MSALVIHPNPAMYLSPEFVQELALGKDKPDDVCARHGVEPSDFQWLSAQAWFGEMVAVKRMQLADNGVLFSAKAEMMLEELLQHLYKSAITGNLAAAPMLELTKQLGDYAGLRTRGAQAAATGPAFQQNINVAADTLAAGRALAPANAEPVNITPTLSIPLGQTTAPKPTGTIGPGFPPGPLGEVPAGLRVPDFKLTPDLVGTPAAQAAASVNAPVALTGNSR
jgi:hypothetical protein